MPRKTRTLLLSLAAIAALAVLAWLLLTTRRSLPLALPKPNGYDEFLKAARVLADGSGDFATMDRDALRTLVSRNAEALLLARQGLSHQCRVPTGHSEAYVNSLVSELGQLKAVARLLAAEGRLAEMENRPADAARSYVEVIRFGNEISRGGLIINRLVGIACEAIGGGALTRLAPKLNGEQARPLIAELESIDNTGVAWNEVWQTERAYIRHQTVNPIRQVLSWWQVRPAKKKAQEKHNRVLSHRRLLTVELALRCHESEQGRAPERLEQLVPRYLQRVPSDPFSGQPLIYHPQGTNWSLYSVGVDGVDDGGRSVGRSVPGSVAQGDLLFDSPW